MPNFWALLINRWQLMGLVLLITILLVSGWIIFSVPQYVASTTLLIEPPQLLTERLDAEDAQDRYYQKHVDVLQSSTVANQVIQALNLQTNPSFADMHNTSVGQQVGEWVQRAFSRLLTYGSYLIVGAAPSASLSAIPAINEATISSALVNRYLSVLTVTSDPFTYATEVMFVTPDPALSQELANTHATIFVRTSQSIRFEVSPEQRAFLAQELAAQEGRLAQAEAALAQLHQDHPNLSPLSKDNLVSQRLLQTQQRLTNAQAKWFETSLFYQLTKEKEPAQLITFIKSDRLAHLRAAFNKLEVEHSRLTTLLAPSHPRLSETVSARDTARQRLEQELTSLVKAFAAEATEARNTEAALREEVAQQRKAALDRGEFNVVAAALNAEIDSVRSLTHLLRKQQQEDAFLKTLPDPNIMITTPAEMPTAAISPQPVRDFLLALLGGTILATGLAFFVEWTDTSVRTAQDVQQATKYPLLGMVPSRAARFDMLIQRGQPAPSSSPQDSDTPMREASLATLPEQMSLQDLLDESYRVLSTKLPIKRGKSPRTFLFVSPYADNDKTNTLLSLAVILAGKGYKVVVVDADLRAGQCHTLLQKDHSMGLSEVLRDGAAFASSSRRRSKKVRDDNHAEIAPSGLDHLQEDADHESQRTRSSPKLRALVESAIQTTTIERLSFVACGQVQLDTEEYLGSQTLPEVLDILSRKFTCVLIDSPAAMTYGDAELLAQLSNATILVLRGHKTPMAAAYRVAGQLQAVRANVLGVVLTNVHSFSPDMLEYH
ncbi:MAG: hypothetical protein FJ147_22660 [Deltaproteobacteria bacterium]|nr:hypothetical protein [Deltaproteobacteria bacterium]